MKIRKSFERDTVSGGRAVKPDLCSSKNLCINFTVLMFFVGMKGMGSSITQPTNKNQMTERISWTVG